MKIFIKNLNNYYDVNLEYNDEVENLVEKILGTEDEEPIGYQLSNKKNFSNKRYDSINRKDKKIINIEARPFLKKLNKINLKEDKLGPLEIKLIEKIFTSPFRSILITGALGSGKTALLKYVNQYIINNINCAYCKLNDLDCLANQVFTVYINFNAKIFGSSLSEIKEKFYTKIYDRFLGHIMSILDFEQITHQFYYDLMKNNLLLKDFSNFRLYLLTNDSSIAASKDVEKKKLFFLNWIKELKLQNRIIYLSHFIDYLSKKFPSIRNGCYLLIFDNIDSVKDEYQGELLKEIWSLVEDANVRSLISLRLTTFRRIEIGHGAYSYGVFQNAGANVIEILIKRFSYFLDNYKNEWFTEAVNNLSPGYFDLLKKRIENLIEILSQKKDKRLNHALLSMSGLSIRRCLYLSERLLINSSIKYTETSCHQDEYINSLLIDNNPSSEINEDDDLITNIFSNKRNQNSLLQIRILQILLDNRRRKRDMSINELINILSCYNKWDSEDIYFAISNLIFYKKRLAYINGVSSYSQIQDLFNSKDDRIEITITGIYYLKYLFENLQYVQTCFYSLDWHLQSEHPILLDEKQGETLFNRYLMELKITNLSMFNRLSKESNLLSKLIASDDLEASDFFPPEIDNLNIFHRISLIRKGISVFLNMDILQSLNHANNISKTDCTLISNRNELIMCSVVSQASWSIFKILHPHRLSIENQDEMKNWYSLLLVTDFWQNSIYNRRSKELARVMNAYYSSLNELKVIL